MIYLLQVLLMHPSLILYMRFIHLRFYLHHWTDVAIQYEFPSMELIDRILIVDKDVKHKIESEEKVVIDHLEAVEKVSFDL